MKKRVLNALLLAGLSVGISLAAYFGWFFITLDLPLSKSPEAWGQFGSYMAGTAGVSFALATVWMLADTLRLQRSELQLSRIEMEKSSKALTTQVEISKRSIEKESLMHILKSVDENIEAISNQTIGNAQDTPLVKILFNNRTLPKGKAQINAIAAQYISLVSYIESLDNDFKKEAISISQPIIIKNYNMLNIIYKNEYFKNYIKELQEAGIQHLKDSKDLIYNSKKEESA